MNIEELAFKDRRTLAQLNELVLLDIIEFLQLDREFLQNDRKQWINQFSKTHNESVEIQEENKELKKQVDEYKKDIKDLDNQNKNSFKNMQLNQLKVCNMAKQQKEFMNYLECEVNDYKCKNPLIVENLHTRYDIRKIETDLLVKILNKYKEIIAGNDNE